MVDIIQSISSGFKNISEAAKRIIKNRLIIAMMEHEAGTSEFEQLSRFSDTVEATMHSENSSIFLEIIYDESIMSTYAYSAVEEGTAMLDTFLSEWIEDLITEDNPEIISAMEEYAHDEISNAFGGN